MCDWCIQHLLNYSLNVSLELKSKSTFLNPLISMAMLAFVCICPFLFFFLCSTCGVIGKLNSWTRPIGFKWFVSIAFSFELDMMLQQMGITSCVVHSHYKLHYAHKDKTKNPQKHSSFQYHIILGIKKVKNKEEFKILKFICIYRFNSNQNFTFKEIWFASLLKQTKHSTYCIMLPQILDDFLVYKLFDFDFLENCTCEVMSPRFNTGPWKSCY